MTRLIKKTLIAGVLTVPAFVSGQSMGVGARVDELSGGVEVRFWIPVGTQTSLFIAPHGFGTYYFNEAGDNGFVNAGLRTGIAFLADNWISPFVGIGAGYTRDASADSSSDYYYEDGYNKYEYLYRKFGARAFAGLSIAPFQLLSTEIEWLKPLNGLRFEFDTGFEFYDYYYYDYDEWYQDTGAGPPIVEIYEYEDKGQTFTFPDIGVGIVFNW